MRAPSLFCRKGHSIALVGRNRKGKGNCRQCSKDWHDARKEHALFYNRFKKYGITRETYNAMFASQGGCCFICQKHQSELAQVLFVDHDHKTGRVRALLCNRCNRHLAWYERYGLKIDEVLNVRVE